MKLNEAKLALRASPVNYLGYTLTGEVIAPGEEKLLAVKEFPPPVSVKQIREFVSLCNYFRFFTPKFAYYSAILTYLTKAKSGYSDGKLPPFALSAFEFLRKKLCESPLVRHPRKADTFHLATDACAGYDSH